MSQLSFHVYKVSTPSGGCLEAVVVDKKDLEYLGSEREAVAHAAWRKLFETRTATGQRVEGNTAGILKGVCDKIGVDKAKRLFTNVITFEKVS